ncbi:MAG TPA: pentapeptide repeat-containing protein [Puia sp.]|nr:pentapeptide repeat-containing protein [Puia sp.]
MPRLLIAIGLQCLFGMANAQAILTLDTLRYARPVVHNGESFDTMVRRTSKAIDADADTVQKADPISFLEIANFFNSRFDCFADFSYMSFYKWMDCSGSKFYGDADFSGSVIEDAGFYGTEFQKDVTFKDCRLLHRAYFIAVELSPRSNLYIRNLTLPRELYFSHNPALPYDIDLTAAKHVDGIKTGLYLYRSDVSKFLFDYRYFQLLFADSLHNEYLSRDEKIAIYEAALKNFKDRGQLESYRLLDIEYHGFKLGFFHLIPLLWNCYGYHNEWIIYWTLLFLTLFSAINYNKLDKLNKSAYRILKDEDLKALEDLPPSWRRRRKTFWYSFFYTSCLFFPLSLKVERIMYERLGITAYVLVIFTSGIICLAYLANFVLQK